jgi:pimeloyl-ACP methyl ester carboxylesterase
MKSKMGGSLTEIRPGRFIKINYIPNQQQQQATVFLLHGLGGRAAQWNHLKEKLRPHANLVIPDFLGHGESQKPRDPRQYKLRELYMDLAVLFERYGSEKNYIVAHSFSGSVATIFLENHQEKVNRAVLITPTTCKPNAILARLYRTFAWLIAIIQMKFNGSFTKFAFSKSANPQLIHQEVLAARKNKMYVIKPLVMEILNMPLVDVSKIHTPILIITADQDTLTPTSRVRSFYGNLPNVRFVEIPQAGHLVTLEKPNLVNRITEIFLFQEN